MSYSPYVYNPPAPPIPLTQYRSVPEPQPLDNPLVTHSGISEWRKTFSPPDCEVLRLDATGKVLDYKLGVRRVHIFVSTNYMFFLVDDKHTWSTTHGDIACWAKAIKRPSQKAPFVKTSAVPNQPMGGAPEESEAPTALHFYGADGKIHIVFDLSVQYEWVCRIYGEVWGSSHHSRIKMELRNNTTKQKRMNSLKRNYLLTQQYQLQKQQYNVIGAYYSVSQSPSPQPQLPSQPLLQQLPQSQSQSQSQSTFTLSTPSQSSHQHQNQHRQQQLLLLQQQQQQQKYQHHHSQSQGQYQPRQTLPKSISAPSLIRSPPAMAANNPPPSNLQALHLGPLSTSSSSSVSSLSVSSSSPSPPPNRHKSNKPNKSQQSHSHQQTSSQSQHHHHKHHQQQQQQSNTSSITASSSSSSSPSPSSHKVHRSVSDPHSPLTRCPVYVTSGVSSMALSSSASSALSSASASSFSSSSSSSSSSDSSSSASSSSSSTISQSCLSGSLFSSYSSLNTPYLVSVPSMTLTNTSTRTTNHPAPNANQMRSNHNYNISPSPPPLSHHNNYLNDPSACPNQRPSSITPPEVTNNTNNNNNTNINAPIKSDKKASCRALKSVGGGGGRRRDNSSMSPVAPRKLSPHPYPLKGDLTLTSLTLNPPSSSSLSSSSSSSSSSNVALNAVSAPGVPLDINLSDVPVVDWSSMPLYPTQDPVLTFGLGTRQAPVDVELRQIVTLVNTSNHKQHFRFCPAADPKCSLSVEPREGRIDPGKDACVVVTATVLCTARFRLELPLVAWRHRGRGMARAAFVCDIESQLTTKLDPDELALHTPPVGEGSFGTTYRGEYRGTDVAIKVIKYQNEITPRMVADFKKETDMLEKLRHPCIIGFIGAVHTPRLFAIVTEFAEFGSLSAVVKRGSLTYAQKLKALLDISRGMRYIHNSGIIHRDLKPDNVLVVSMEASSSVMCKLSDFGSTRDVNKFSPDLALTRGVGTPIFMAPELLAGKSDYRKSADVYSFAMSMVNVISGKLPFEGEPLSAPWYQCVLSGVRPEMVGCCVPDDYMTLVRMCWAANPDERPEFDFVVRAINEMFRKEVSNFKK